MNKTISKLPFKGTPAQAQSLAAVIRRYKEDKSQLMTVMQQAQSIYGYLPFEVQREIADGMEIPLEKVYGVSTFYSQFALSPAGKHNISVCLGTACYVRGAQAILDEISEQLGIRAGETTEDGLFSIQPCRCIGACGLAPVMMIDDTVYGTLKPAQIKDILDSYRRVERKDKEI